MRRDGRLVQLLRRNGPFVHSVTASWTDSLAHNGSKTYSTGSTAIPSRSPLTADDLFQVKRKLGMLPRRRVKTAGTSRPAAVLMPFCNVNGAPRIDHLCFSVLFTRRADTIRLHGGEVCFPGGKADEGDTDIIHTALREFEEELLLPSSSVQVLGLFHDCLSLTKIPVTPVLGFVGNFDVEQPSCTLDWKPFVDFNVDEISDVFSIKVEELVNPAFQRSDTNRMKEFTAGPFAVWGLTAYITDGVLSYLWNGVHEEKL